MWIHFLSIFLLTFFVLDAGLPVSDAYFRPTESFIRRTSWKKIERELKEQQVSKKSIEFLKNIPESEAWGHIGYHGSTRSYRIYQDIIRIVVEEILTIKVREDFQFLRTPGDEELNLNSMDEFISFWGGELTNNRSSLRAKQLFSLNFCLYSNYKNTHSSSIFYFVKNSSSGYRDDVNYKAFLDPFFCKLGIDSSVLDYLFLIGEKWLANEKGVLLQLSENSHLTDPSSEAYNFLDQQGYPSKAGGYRYSQSHLSEHYRWLMTEEYASRKVSIAPQLRLLMNNRYTLNPYSHLIVKRWEETDPFAIANYEAELRTAIQSVEFDAKKVALFREHLLSLWCESGVL